MYIHKFVGFQTINSILGLEILNPKEAFNNYLDKKRWVLVSSKSTHKKGI